MTTRERFLFVLSGKIPDDRFPMVEWAPWWSATKRRWESEGFPQNLSYEESLLYFGLDELHGIYCAPALTPAQEHGKGIITDDEDYFRLKESLYIDAQIEGILSTVGKYKSRHDNGEIILRVSLDGFFWFPRSLFGIEPHLYAFYDYPELMTEITKDLYDFNMKFLKELFKIIKPDFVNYAEDMSYNHGSMLSEKLFDTYIKPHYIKLNDLVHANNVKVLIDTDGDMTTMIPWLLKSGVDGIFPLERQANVDITEIRRDYPKLIMLGGYDKMVMNKGEDAIRAEFERILPVMKSGYYIPSVDHQTPPGVSFGDYKTYIKVFNEYCKKAVE